MFSVIDHHPNGLQKHVRGWDENGRLITDERFNQDGVLVVKRR
jgi:hypothetical protein